MIHTPSITTQQKAFSMIELIFVIVILGIVASIGSEVIAKTYEGYISQRTLHNASIKTELAATQIANRLARAVPGTIIRRTALMNGNLRSIVNTATPDYTILQWVGADIDSFDEGGWSGLADIQASTVDTQNLSTPGSNLSLAATIINNLSNNLGTANARIFINLSTGLHSYPIRSFPVAGSILQLRENLGPLSEHYKLAWTSYALEVVDADGDGKGDLTLHYRFLPIVNTNITNHQSSILLKNVTTFEFRGDGNAVRFKLCVRESPTGIALDDTIICKEKAVF